MLGSQVFYDGIGLEDMGSNVVGIRSVCGIEVSTVKEADGPRLRRFRKQVAEEGAESRVDLLWRE